MNIKKFIKDLIPYVIIFVVVVVVRVYFITPVKVSGDSMSPALNNGDILLLNKYYTDYERFNIVVLNESVIGDAVIKRIVGMPGEEIEIENGSLYINKLKYEDIFSDYIMGDMESIILGENEYFVLGDNREVSLDSRSFGAVNESDLLGIVTFSVWPIKNIE